MDEFVCLTIAGRPGETPSQLQSRLYAFWTHILRQKPDDYEQVYAEATEFEDEAGVVTRRYMVRPVALPALTGLLLAGQWLRRPRRSGRPRG